MKIDSIFFCVSIISIRFFSNIDEGYFLLKTSLDWYIFLSSFIHSFLSWFNDGYSSGHDKLFVQWKLYSLSK